jgi:hypothetical protein
MRKSADVRSHARFLPRRSAPHNASSLAPSPRYAFRVGENVGHSGILGFRAIRRDKAVPIS